MKRGNGSGNPNMKQLETPNEANALQREIELLRERLGDKDNVIDDLRRRLDEEAEERRMTQAKLTALLTHEREKAPQKPIEGRFTRAWSLLTGKV